MTIPSNSAAYILIIWDSMTGGSESMAKSAAIGVKSQQDIGVKIKHADRVNSQEVRNAAGYIFVFPENLAAISGRMKGFFDRTYYDCIEHIEGRPYALMVCAGSDGENAVRQAMRICKGWRLKPIQDSMIVKTYAQTKEEILAPKTIADDELQKCRDIAAAMANGISMGIF